MNENGTPPSETMLSLPSPQEPMVTSQYIDGELKKALLQ